MSRDCVANRSRQIEQLKRCEIIPEAAVKDLCTKAKEILMEEGNVLYVDSPVTVSFNTVIQSSRPGDMSPELTRQDMWRYTWAVP
jgi:hypothetical protein